MIKLFLFFCFFTFTNLLSAQDAIDVTDQTIKIGARKEEELLFAFAAGDKIIFSFQEAGKKELKEVEILEYPTSSKYSDYKTASIEKTFNVNRQGIYVFRFKNSAISGRICRINIKRIPGSESTKDYNTSVSWNDKQDTTWNSYVKEVITGYDTSYVQKTRKELVKVDTLFIPLFDKQIRVHSETAIGKEQTSYATVILPTNYYSPNAFNIYESKEVVAWSYWIGVGQKSMEEYKKANDNVASGIANLGSLMGYGLLAKLASSGISILSNSNVGDNVQYQFLTYINSQPIVLDYGNIVSASGRNERLTQGSFLVKLFNDNFREGIDVNVKMVAMQVHKIWKDIPYTSQVIKPKTEKQLFKEPVIKNVRIPVAVQ